MANATARITGYVLRVDRRSGVSKASGEPWSMCNVLVLVGQSGVAEATLPKDWSAPSQGEEVDYLVEARTYNGSVSFSVIERFPAVEPAHAGK